MSQREHDMTAAILELLVRQGHNLQTLLAEYTYCGGQFRTLFDFLHKKQFDTPLPHAILGVNVGKRLI